MSDETSLRLAREQAFHDVRFTEETREAQSKYYFAVEDGAAHYRRRIGELARGADLLEYGCAKGSVALDLARDAKHVTGIDISPVAITQAQDKARNAGITNATFEVMNAEEMSYPDGSFDLIFGSGIIHHLDVDKSLREVKRVLRPGGHALFWEPLGHNPIINLYRRLTPNARTPDEHPLLKPDFDTMQKHFGDVEVSRYGLLSIAAVPFREQSFGSALRGALGTVDKAIFAMPGSKWWCWYTCVELTAG